MSPTSRRRRLRPAPPGEAGVNWLRAYIFHVLAGVLVLLLAVAGATTWLTWPNDSEGSAPRLNGVPANASLIARGEYLARAADCAACHTVKEGKPFAGGLAFTLPFGKLWSSNITADKETGIGSWSDDDFVRALHEGIRRDGQRLYPAFPYTSYTALSRADALAIKAYLFSLPPVRQETPRPALGFPFNQRWAMGFWNAVFFKSERFAADPKRSAQWNQGAYLATALGHCNECHTPRNLGFALDHGQELAGTMLEGWRAVNITSDSKYGIGAWSDAEIVSYLVDGHADGRGSAAGPMGEAVEKSLQYLDPEDARALVAWLRTVAPRHGKNPIDVDRHPALAAASTRANPVRMTSEGEGFALFAGACASCHAWDGSGRQTRYASLAGSSSVNDPSGASVTQVILKGVDMHIHGQAIYMPAFGSAYTDEEVASLANYVIGQYGAKAGRVSPAMVASQRDAQ